MITAVPGYSLPLHKETEIPENPTSLREGQILTGPLFNEPMRVETVRANGPDTWVAGLVGIRSEQFRNVTLTSRDLKTLTIHEPSFTFDGNGQILRLGVQAYSLGIAYEFDPYFGLSISRVDPLPHQGVDFSVTVRTDVAGSLASDLRQILDDLGLADKVRIDEG